MTEMTQEQPGRRLTKVLEGLPEASRSMVAAVVAALTSGLSERDLHELSVKLAEHEIGKRDAVRASHLAAARQALAQGELMAARANAEAIIQLDFTDAEAHALLGETLEDLGDIDDAHTHYTLALQFGAEAPEVGAAVRRTHRPEAHGVSGIAFRYDRTVERARGYLEKRRLRQAESCARRAIEIDGDRPEAYNLLGVALEVLGERTEAQTQYRIALELAPDYEPAAVNLAGSTGPREQRSRPSW